MDELISLDLLMRARAEGLGELEHAHNLLLGLSKAALALAAIAGGAIVAFSEKAVEQFVAAGNAAYQMSERFNIAPAMASAWVEAGKHFGVGGDEITRAFQRVSVQMGRMEEQFHRTHKLTGPLVQVFKELGIQMQDGHGHFRSMNDIMLDSMDALGKMTDVQNRATISSRIFGLASGNMIEMMMAGRSGIDAEMALVEKMGSSLTDN